MHNNWSIYHDLLIRVLSYYEIIKKIDTLFLQNSQYSEINYPNMIL